jgi:hypothetical protein
MKDAGMSMPALVFWMPMPTYGNMSHFSKKCLVAKSWNKIHAEQDLDPVILEVRS